MARLSFSVNGEIRSIETDPDTPLLWILRDHLNLTGTKYGCGAGICGACAIHLNGAVVRSCAVTVGEADGQTITTIEGLSSRGTHPLQRAWIEEDVSQCGYCQPGQIMTAAALLDRNPHPTDAEIETAMNDNLCRCGTHLRIKRAIRRAVQGGGR